MRPARIYIVPPKLSTQPTLHLHRTPNSQFDIDLLANIFQRSLNDPSSMRLVSFEQGYRACYLLVLHRRGADVYAFLKRVLRRARSLAGAHRREFLSLVSGFALYVDRAYCVKHGLTPIHELAKAVPV